MINNLLNRIEEKLNNQRISEKDIVGVMDDPSETKTKIEVKVTYEEKQLIKSMAKLNHMNMSEFIRYVILTKYINNFIQR